MNNKNKRYSRTVRSSSFICSSYSGIGGGGGSSSNSCRRVKRV